MPNIHFIQLCNREICEFSFSFFCRCKPDSPFCGMCVCFSGWLVCQQDYTKAKELTDLSLSLEKATLTFGVDLDKGKDPGSFLTFLNIVQ